MKKLFFWWKIEYLKKKQIKKSKKDVEQRPASNKSYRRLQVTRQAFCRARPKSNTEELLEDGPGETDLFGNFDKFFSKKLSFLTISSCFGNSCFEDMSKQKRMQSDVFGYRLYEGQKYGHR